MAGFFFFFKSKVNHCGTVDFLGHKTIIIRRSYISKILVDKHNYLILNL